MANIIFDHLRKKEQRPSAETLEQVNQRLETLNDSLNEFKNEYHDILAHVNEQDWCYLAGITENEMDTMSVRDVMERIRERHGVMIPSSNEQMKGISSILPEKYIIPNNKLPNALTKKGVELAMELDLTINEKKNIVTKVDLDFNESGITLYGKNKEFTPYDRSVLNAVCSVFEVGNTNFTPSQIYRCMNGLTDGEKVSPKSIEAITESIDKMRRTYMKIDCSKEAQAYRNEPNFKAFIEDYILSAKKVTLINGNDKVIGYSINNKPILYEYAQFTKQVVTVPNKWLNTKDVIRSTPDVIVIREYLLRRIEGMKNPNNKLSNKILFSKIFETIRLEKPTKQKAQKVRETVEKILTKYKKEGYIKNFKFTKKANAFDGVVITY